MHEKIITSMKDCISSEESENGMSGHLKGSDK